VSRLRPFARRRLRTFRPPCVFIRSRKPCVFFRRRVFGWYVRLIGNSFHQTSNLRSVLTAFSQVKTHNPLASAFHGVVRCRPHASRAVFGTGRTYAMDALAIDEIAAANRRSLMEHRQPAPLASLATYASQKSPKGYPHMWITLCVTGPTPAMERP